MKYNRAMPKKLTGQIIKIKNGKYQIRVQRNVGGVRKSISQIFNGSKEDAKTFRDNLIADIRKKDKEPKREYKNVDDVFDAYLKIIKPTVAPQTFLLYQRIIKGYLRDQFGKINVLELQSFDIENYYAELQKTLSSVTIQKVHTQLKAALGKARSWRWIDYNPCSDIRPPKISQAKKDVLTSDEINRFLAAAGTARTFWTFFAVTGARAGEVFGARWSDIESGVWNVSQTLIQAPGMNRFDKPKTSNSVRSIPLPSSVIELLKRHKVEQNKVRLKQGAAWNDLDLVFPTNTGKPQRLSNIGEKCAKIKTAAGIDKNVTPHTFRRTFSSLLIDGGIGVKKVSQVLGHSSVKLTLDVYTQLPENSKEEISEWMNKKVKIG